MALIEALALIDIGQATETPQNDADATYAHKVDRGDDARRLDGRRARPCRGSFARTIRDPARSPRRRAARSSCSARESRRARPRRPRRERPGDRRRRNDRRLRRRCRADQHACTRPANGASRRRNGRADAASAWESDYFSWYARGGSGPSVARWTGDRAASRHRGGAVTDARVAAAGDLRRSPGRRSARSGVRSPDRASRRARPSLDARAGVRHAAPSRAARRAISTRAFAAASFASTPICSTSSGSAPRSCCTWRACRRTRRSRRPSSSPSDVTASARASSRTPCFAGSIASATRSCFRRQRSDRRAGARGIASALARRALGRAMGHRRNASDCSRRTIARHRSIARPYHVVREQLEAMLETAGVHVGDAPLVRDSIVLSSPVSSLTELGPFRQGLFHLQDPASTLVTQYACVPTGRRRRRSCARRRAESPSSCRAARRTSSRATSRSRGCSASSRTLVVSRSTRCTAYVADARFPAIRPVDLVLVDAPCTGTGTFRRHPDARWRLKISDLAVMASIQRGDPARGRGAS